MQAGDNVLIHAGGSSVGLAAVQLVRAAGAKAFVTAGSDQKIQQAVQLGAAGGVNRHNHPMWKDEISKLAPGGMQVILDCVGASYAMQNAEVLATDGRWVLYGSLGGGQVDPGPLLSALLRKRGQLLASTLKTRSLPYKRDLVAQFSSRALPKFQDQTFQYVGSRRRKIWRGVENNTCRLMLAALFLVYICDPGSLWKKSFLLSKLLMPIA